MKKPKAKECAICKKEFTQFNSAQTVCSMKCAVEQERRNNPNRKRTRNVSPKIRLKSKTYYNKKAQEAFNAFIRYRDRNLPCVSCGKTIATWNAGHYQSRGAHPELRFHEDNCHKQCVHCNSFKHGNLIEYRIELVKRIGTERVEWLEGKHEPLKLSKEKLMDIRQTYIDKLNKLKSIEE